MFEKTISLVAAGSAVLAAVVTGYVGYRTSELENAATKAVAKLESETNRKIAEFQTKTTQTIAFLQDETIRVIEKKRDEIERAKLFRELIKDLGDRERSNLALLALWKLYQDEKDRKVIVLAALETQNTRTLLLLGKEMEPHLQTVLNIANQGDSATSKAAGELVGNLTAEQLARFQLVDEAARYYLTEIEKTENELLSPYDSNVETLIELATTNPAVRPIIIGAAQDSPGRQPLLYYVLYAAGDRDELRSIFQNTLQNPRLFRSLRNVLCCGEFVDEDIETTVKIPYAYLAAHAELNESDTEAAIALLSHPRIGALSPQMEQNIIDRCQVLFLDRVNFAKGRSRALDCLVRWSPKRVIPVASKVLSDGESNILLQNSISVAFNTLRQAPELDEQLSEEDLPEVNADPTIWRQWRSTHDTFLSGFN
ncbi:MAG: hypothetical protein O7I42_11510 [Alphaproteobacteria bacterium]|nr:hypothetical protein [Alphaproteobacteria bacterium]